MNSEVRTAEIRDERVRRRSGMEPFAPASDFSLTFSDVAVIRWLFRIAGVFVIFHLINVAFGWPSPELKRLFDIGLETNLPTWFSSVLWLIAAVSSLRCSQLGASRYERWHWLLASAFLLFISVDEVALIHEKLLALILKEFAPNRFSQLRGAFKFSMWPILTAPILVLVFIWLGTTLRKLMKDSPSAWKLVLLGFSTVVLGGAIIEMTVNFIDKDSLGWLLQIEVALEESLEMFGVITIISGLFAYLRTRGFEECQSQLRL